MNKQNIILLSVILLVVIVFIGLFLLNKGDNFPLLGSLSSTGTEGRVNNKEPVKEPVKELVIQAFQFGYNPDRIVVKKGERIKLTINNTDTLHGIRIPELGISGNDFVEFVGDKNGEFIWYCNNFCGDGHRQMQGTLIVEE